ncbi:MAG: glycosyltransferase family 39 protein [Anaerolineales bacterium]|nr:glycosyltransferase family 39 protein [Anaerolineales bacterium]
MNEEFELEEWVPWLALFVTALGGFLRVLMIGTKGLWLDETVSIWLAKQSVADMLQWIVKIDPHPPLYYLLLHFWMTHYGDTPYYIRLLSALFGTATIPVVYLIGKRISGEVVGLSAAVFFALSTFNIYFAQEARMYTLLTFNAAMAIYALSILITNPRSLLPMGGQFREYLRVWWTTEPVSQSGERDPRFVIELPKTGWRAWLYRIRQFSVHAIETDLAWAAFMIFSAATLLTHNTAVLFPVAANTFVLGLMFFQRMKKNVPSRFVQAPSIGNWVKAQIGIFILWSPWLPAFIQQVRRVDQEFWLPKPDWNTITQTLRALLNASAPTQASQIMTWILCTVLILGLVYFRKDLSKFFFLAALFVIPVLGELIVSIHRPIFYGRTLIWITIPMVLLLAAGIAQLRFRFLIILMLGLLSTNYLFSVGDYFRFTQKEDWKTAAGYVAYSAQKDDLVLFNSNFIIIPFEYYFKPYEKLYLIQVDERGVPFDLYSSGVLEPKMTTDDVPALVSLLDEYNRVWLVYSHNDYTDPDSLIPQTLALHMKLIQEKEFYGGKVLLYEKP